MFNLILFALPPVILTCLFIGSRRTRIARAYVRTVFVAAWLGVLWMVYHG